MRIIAERVGTHNVLYIVYFSSFVQYRRGLCLILYRSIISLYSTLYGVVYRDFLVLMKKRKYDEAFYLTTA